MFNCTLPEPQLPLQRCSADYDVDDLRADMLTTPMAQCQPQL